MSLLLSFIFDRRWIYVLVVCLSFPAFSQVKRALVFGLGTYEDKNWNRIHGDKDVPFVIDMLEQSGFTDIRSLVNAQATKQQMVTCMRQIARKCQRGDKVYIHFSGHGQQITDTDGDEEDGWDEAWIPYDAYLNYGEKDRGEKHLSDDEIGILLSDIKKRIGKTGLLLVVVDACHSGDSSRDLQDGECVRGVIQKFEIPLDRIPARVKRKEEPWIMISACKSYQLNMEITDPPVGKLTYGLYQLRSVLGKLENDEVEKELSLFYGNHRGTLIQTPVISGQKDIYKIKDIF